LDVNARQRGFPCAAALNRLIFRLAGISKASNLTTSRSDNRFLEETRQLVKDLEDRTARANKAPEDGRQAIKSALSTLRKKLREDEIAEVRASRDQLEALVETHLLPYEKSAFREYFEAIGIAILAALFLRAFAIEAFKIPSGSMQPTLLIGDHLFVTKFAYGIRLPFTSKYLVEFGSPDRGDVVVFSFPKDEARKHLQLQPAAQRSCIDSRSLTDEKDMIKRVIGVEGDTIEVRANAVVVNGEPLKRLFLAKEPTGNYLNPYENLERETSDGHEYTVRFVSPRGGDFGPIKVAPGHLFVMGDNRDQSSDSRCWGQVPAQNVKGKALVIWWSLGEDGTRWERFSRVIR